MICTWNSGTNQEEVANLALVGEAIFRELFNGMECVTRAYWQFICQILTPGCSDSCEPILMCPSACEDIKISCPALYEWVIDNAKNVDRLVGWVGNLGPAAKLLEDMLKQMKSCTFMPQYLFGDSATCGWKPRNRSQQAEGNCTMAAEAQYKNKTRELYIEWTQSKADFYDAMKIEREN